MKLRIVNLGRNPKGSKRRGKRRIHSANQLTGYDADGNVVSMYEVPNRQRGKIGPRKLKKEMRLHGAVKFKKAKTTFVRRNLKRTERSPKEFIIEMLTSPSHRKFKFFYWNGTSFVADRSEAERFISQKRAWSKVQAIQSRVNWNANVLYIRVVNA